MRKITFISAFLISVLFVSCSSESEQLASKNSIEGKWEYDVEGRIVNNQVKLFDYQHSASVSKDVLEFNGNGEVKDIYFYNDNSSDQMQGVWFKKGNQLTVSFDDQTQLAEILELNATTLKLQYTIKESKYLKIFRRVSQN